ncbi:hypothetical protein [Xenorhabdus littoralis]|uniref:hypothetical protein n=1 Tax=Xenorhabdus littoralis TaxID=2582835 RepID=UPI0029E7D671|nr:hypothetical protein [Xenorhabdus sp. Reich]
MMVQTHTGGPTAGDGFHASIEADAIIAMIDKVRSLWLSMSCLPIKFLICSILSLSEYN